VEPHYIGREESEYSTYAHFCGQGLQRCWNYWSLKAKHAYADLADR